MQTRSLIYAFIALSIVAGVCHLSATSADSGTDPDEPYLTETQIKALIAASEQRQFQIRKKFNADLIAQARDNLVPVHRFWNHKSGSQLLVFSDRERDKLLEYPSNVLTYEGQYGWIVGMGITPSTEAVE